MERTSRPMMSRIKASEKGYSIHYIGALIVSVLFLVIVIAGVKYSSNSSNSAMMMSSYDNANEKLALRIKPHFDGIGDFPSTTKGSNDASSIRLMSTSSSTSKEVINVATKPQVSQAPLPIPSTSKAHKASSTTHSDFLDSRCLRTIEKHQYELHIVPPPPGPVDLVCCMTTKGPINIAVHKTWAPIGAQNFLNMVNYGFFDHHVALFRAIKGFLVQFGLAGDQETQVSYEKDVLGGKGSLKDDPQWLPAGPPGRVIDGVERFRKGYLSYAGAGKNSRGTQLIMAFQHNKYLGGGSPWEVPFGQVIGENSLKVIDNIYTGYAEKISQGKIRNRGYSYLKEEFPLVDYIFGCNITATEVPWVWHNASII